VLRVYIYEWVNVGYALPWNHGVVAMRSSNMCTHNVPHNTTDCIVTFDGSDVQSMHIYCCADGLRSVLSSLTIVHVGKIWYRIVHVGKIWYRIRQCIRFVFDNACCRSCSQLCIFADQVRYRWPLSLWQLCILHSVMKWVFVNNMRVRNWVPKFRHKITANTINNKWCGRGWYIARIVVWWLDHWNKPWMSQDRLIV
jgi:hypothetical protein